MLCDRDVSTKLESNHAEKGEDGTAVAATASWSYLVQPELTDPIALNQIPRAEPSARAECRASCEAGLGSRNRGLRSGTGYLTERQPNFGKELGQNAFLGKRKKRKENKKEEIKASPRSLSPPQFLSHAETHNTRRAQRENNPGLLETSGFQQLFKNEIETLQNFHQAAAGRRSPVPFPPEEPFAQRARCSPRTRETQVRVFARCGALPIQ